MSENYGATLLPDNAAAEGNANDEVQISVSEDSPNKPTLGPIGRKMKRNAQIQYNPYDWPSTLFMFHDGSYVTKTFYVVAITGTVLVLLSGVAGIGLDEDDRACRAWCSRFALGTQPHSYMGFILFLLMAFRTREAYRMYQAGLGAHYKAKEMLRRFVDAVLFKIPRKAIDENKRGRMIAFCVALPYSFTADMREERHYDDDSVNDILAKEDYDRLRAASSMPLFLIENLVVMVRKYVEGKGSTFAIKRCYLSLEQLYGAYGEMERIKQSPCAFAYVAHLRFLLITYLVTLPLALVEQMGYSTIIVYWVICYGLMSLEMMAVEVENPYGYGTSDLRMHEYNLLVRESILESWNRWKENIVEETAASDDLLTQYDRLKTDTPLFDESLDGNFTWW